MIATHFDLYFNLQQHTTKAKNIIMTTHIEAFLWGAFAHVETALFGTSSSSTSIFEFDDRHLAASDGHDGVVDTHAMNYTAEYPDASHAGASYDTHASGVDATHIAYEDLYASIIFFACIYVGGQNK